MPEFARPRVVVSRCLGFAACRWNGATISDAFVKRLHGHVTFCPVCPEVEIGLGCPRDPIRVVERDGERHLVQPATGRDVSGAMRAYAGRTLDAVGRVDGFLLKSRSPSCGIKDVKIYGGPEGKQPHARGEGFFGGAVLERFGRLAVEDEGRLNNFRIREHFLTKLFTLAAFREVAAGGKMRDLVDFHARNKGLLMGYHQTQLRAMGRIVANHEQKPPEEVFAAYGDGLSKALARPPRFTSMINVLMHALGHVGEGLGADEKAFFLDHLQRYREGKVPLSVLTTLVRSWAVRFEQPYLMGQTYLAPYPEALVEITDSGKGRGG
ncbi:MAG: DUF523 and DUF1722 domain-containing protein [Phycisphaerae bacterium]